MLTQNNPRLCRTRVCEQYIKVKGHNFKDKGPKVKLTLQSTSPVIDLNAMKQLLFYSL